MTEITGCYSDTTLELIVQIPPPVSNPPALEYCDADADVMVQVRFLLSRSRL